MTILTVSCVFTLVTLLSAENWPCEEKNERREAPVPMCQTIFLESNGRKWAGNSPPNAADPAPLRALEENVILVARTRVFAGPVPLEMRKKPLESFLLNWIFTRTCPTNSGQCSIEHHSVVLSQQRKLPQERCCLTDSAPRSGQLLSQSLMR